jgi:hypothetical protein
VVFRQGRFADDCDTRLWVLGRSVGLRPPVEIAYARLLHKGGRYRVRITAGNAPPIIVGDFLDKQEALAWLTADRAPVPDRGDVGVAKPRQVAIHLFSYTFPYLEGTRWCPSRYSIGARKARMADERCRQGMLRRLSSCIGAG